jgi:hypothetical protein
VADGRLLREAARVYDPQDNRIFPQDRPDPVMGQWRRIWFRLEMASVAFLPARPAMARLLIVRGAPSLAMQNSEYLLNQLEAFANQTRTNDINMPMRTIAARLTKQERQALAQYYGSGLGLGLEPAGATGAK